MTEKDIQIVDSFVHRDIKSQGAGSGEAKLHIGSISDKNKLNEFFDEFTNIECYFEKTNIEAYVNDVLSLYLPNTAIKKSADILSRHLKSLLAKFPINKFTLSLYEDETRCYLKSEDNQFKDWLRKVALPYITVLKIKKEENSKYKFTLSYTDNNITILNTENSIIKLSKLDNSSIGNLNFNYKNILFKGVPGTGKSFTIDKIIKEKLDLSKNSPNILRINIHSASSNSDLMQGIGISSKNGKVQYKEKQGLIYNHIKNAILHPYQPFVLILEEIQENSLNELIGDLIYLIEYSKRLDIKSIIDLSEDSSLLTKELEYQELIDELILLDKDKHYVEIPFLIENRTDYRKMILPSNLYIFCTSNYRDDRKIIEDNLLRRFEVIEIYPKYDSEENPTKIYKNEKVSTFLNKLNTSIIEQFSEIETHPDRFIIGHANWQNILTIDEFYRALLKVIIEFKDIKDIEFSDVKSILNRITSDRFIPNDEFNTILSTTNYKELIEIIQEKSKFDFL